MESQKAKSVDLTPKFRELREFLKTGNHFVLTGHVRADGDCVGAQTALFHLLVALGKKATILNPDPLSPRYHFLQEHTQFQYFDPQSAQGKLPDSYDGLFVLDVNTLKRTGPMESVLRAGKTKKIVFDHHVPNEEEKWDLELIDASAAATGLLIYRFAKAENIPLNAAASQGIFLSLVTDTGWFKYSNTDAETFRVASELVASGVDPSIIFQHVYQQRSLEWTSGLHRALESVRFEANGKLAVAVLPQGLKPDAAAELSDSEEILDILRAVRSVEVVAVCRADQPGKVKVSLRSKGDYNVNQFARRYGGGGHRKASGMEISGALAEVADRLGKELAADLR